jgi:hypothetical protein
MPTQALAALNLVDFNWVTSLDNVWTDAAPTAPDHNQQAYNSIYGQLKDLSQTNQTGSPLGRIVIGEGGSGKTYLARILHAQVLTDGSHFVLVDCTDVRDFWETVLLSYVKSLLRPYQGETQVKRLLSFLFTDIAGSEVPSGFFDTMTGVPSGALQVYLTALLSNNQIKALLAKSVEALGLPIVRPIIRALCLLHSSDEDLHDLGYGWLLGQGLESSEAVQLKLTNTIGKSYSHAQIVKGLSWLMAQHAPTLLVLDQLDPIIAQYHVAAAIGEGPNDERLRAKAIIEGLGGGLSKLYDNTYRTVSTIFALHNSWKILQETTLSSNLERFHPPVFLTPMNSRASVTGLLENRLRPAYETAGFNPSYSTYPFPDASLTELGNLGLYPRQLLKRFAEYRERCLLQGSVQEFRLNGDAVIASPTLSVDFSKLVEERAAKADVAKLLEETQEDELGKRLASLCEALIYEIGTQSKVTFTYECDFHGGNYPSLHARLKKIDHGDQEREEHYCLRALQKTNHSAFRARLGAALTEAGIDQGLSFRRLVLFRNAKTIPGGVKTKEVYDKFIKAGGKVCPLSVKDLQVIEAVRGFLQEKALGFTTWLAQEKPLSQLPVVKDAFADLFPQSAVSPAGISEESPPTVSAPEPAAPLKKDKPAPVPATTVTPAGQPGTKSPTLASALVLPLGLRFLGSAPQEEITLPAAALTKHTVIRAGSGGGKTVLVKRLIEEAALLGIPSIVLDPGNDLAWLGDPWPTSPTGWQEGDAEKAKAYFDQVDVVVWTPGKSQGRSLNLPVLPDLKEVADDKDSLNDAVALAQASLIPLCAAGRSVTATRKQGVLAAALKAFSKVGGNLNAFIEFLSELPPEGTGNINNATKLGSEMADTLRASILNNPLLEEDGQMLDIGVLFGLGHSKTRISVISFVGLVSLEAQQQFVNQLAMALFTWIKKHPSVGPAGVTGLFVLDEAKDFLPGGSNTSPCKKSLMRLAAQARKYGLGMVVATQNPKDLDYNAVAQFATQFFGRANSPQVIEFIDSLLQAKGGSGEGVARLQKGQFYATSSEGLAHPVKIKIPLCLSNHPDGRPLTESEIMVRSQSPLP